MMAKNKTRNVKKSPRPTGLTLLGAGTSKPSKNLEAFPNAHPERNYVVTFKCEEFTCLCPVTGQPDFASLEISYTPNDLCLESKSLKLYLWTYRDVGMFHEQVVNQILDDVAKFLSPRWIKVVGHFNVRGGIAIDVEAEQFCDDDDFPFDDPTFDDLPF